MVYHHMGICGSQFMMRMGPQMGWLLFSFNHQCLLVANFDPYGAEKEEELSFGDT